MCGLLKIISAPSPVMGPNDDAPTHFHIHTFVAGRDGLTCLLPPERPVRIRASRFNSAGFWLLRAIKQFADPSARRMLAAETEDGNSDRNADEGAEEAPQKCPQQGREQHERGRNR